MSLLNEMLSNLDSRRQSAVPESEGLMVNPAEVKPRRWSGWLIGLLLVLGTGFVLERYQLINLSVSQAPVLVEADEVKPSAVAPDQVDQAINPVEPVSVKASSGSASTEALDDVQLESASVSAAGTNSSANPVVEPMAESLVQPIEPVQSVSQHALPENALEQTVEVATPGRAAETTPPETAKLSHSAAGFILQQPADHYAVQLVALPDEVQIREYAADKGLDSPLYVKTFNNGITWYVLLLGVYPDYSGANDAIADWNRSGGPPITTWVRQLGPLQKLIVTDDGPTLSAKSVDPADHADEIERLLKQAERALLRERLTFPVHDNAYDRYRHVLQLVPGHPVAQQGIHRIVEIYLKLAGEYRDAGNLERARWLIGLAEQVEAENPEIAAQPGRSQTAGTSEVSRPASAPRLPDPLPMASVDEDIKVKQASGIAMREKSLLAEVEVLLQQGAEAEARRSLERFLINHPGSPSTVEVLFRLYLHLDKPDLASQLLNRSTQLPASMSTKLSAQLQIKKGNLMGAVKLLEEGDSHDQDASYSALLAGLYQKLGRYSEAVGIYKDLLSSEPEKGAYWLGLAVSLDALQEYEDARAAFQHTVHYGNYDGDVRQYIEQRIQALSK